VVVEQARKMINLHQFNNEPIRILLAGLSSGLHQTDSFIASPFQKHMLREVKFADLAARNKDQMRWNPRTRRYGTIGGGKVAEEDEDEVGEEPIVGEDARAVSDIPKPPSKQNPVILTLYGQFCVTAKSYQSAICRKAQFTVGPS
jgi:general transcription factor 3C polypeptide 3 (transcription factor C subunit 4)